MNVSLYIAKRYLFSKKSHNVINIISGISMLGIGIGTMALVIVLSAFNGLQGLVNDLYSSFDPDIKITANAGKTFNYNNFPTEEITSLAGVEHFSKALEETVLLKLRDKQAVATLKGVEDEFIEMSGLDTLIVNGELKLKEGNIPMALVGYGIAYQLNLYFGNDYKNIVVYTPKKNGKVNVNNPESAFSKHPIVPSGAFTINPDFDDKYILVPFSFAAKALEDEVNVSSVELGLIKRADENKIKDQIKEILGDEYKVQTRYEQNELIYKTNNIEKWITFLILAFILIVATFNVVSSLAMLVIDKTKDINILKSMGASEQLVRNVFVFEGMLITILGAFMGMAVGLTICILQQQLGFIKLNGILVDTYPVDVQLVDFILIFATVLVIGALSSLIPVRLIASRYFAKST